MKYIITENRMESIIDSYLSKQFNNLESHIDKHIHYWVDDEGIPEIIFVFFDFDTKDKSLTDVMGYVREDIPSELINLFSLNNFDEVQKYLINWISSHLEINLDTIYTFNEHEWKYIY